eukprot:658507-Rhodomonas_salina.1
MRPLPCHPVLFRTPPPIPPHVPVRNSAVYNGGPDPDITHPLHLPFPRLLPHRLPPHPPLHDHPGTTAFQYRTWRRAPGRIAAVRVSQYRTWRSARVRG